MTTTPLTDAMPRLDYATPAHSSRDCTEWVPRDLAAGTELKLRKALALLKRCRDSAGRMEMGLYDEIQHFLHFNDIQPRQTATPRTKTTP